MEPGVFGKRAECLIGDSAEIESRCEVNSIVHVGDNSSK